MKPLSDLKQEFKNLVPIGIDVVLKTLKQHIPVTSAKFNDLIELESRYRDNHKKIHKGTISSEAAILVANQIREALLVFIDGLEDKDFDTSTPAINKKGHRTGKILYRIPEVMQVEVEATCLVRIAFDEESLTYDISLQAGDEIKTLRRVSEVMSVELIDPSEHHPFAIRSFSEPIQFVDEDDFTEWRFYVKPLKEGEFSLLLKVSVIELKLGKERKRDIVLEERVQIITAAPQHDEQAQGFKEARETLNTAEPYELSETSTSVRQPAPSDTYSSLPKFDKVIQPSPGNVVVTGPISSAPAPGKSRSLGGGAKKGIVYMLALLIFTSATWAVPAVREEIRWVNVSLIKNNKAAFERYKERYPDSRRMTKIENKIETFEWKEVVQATGDKKLVELKDYRKKYTEKNGRHFKQATEALAKIEFDQLTKSHSVERVEKFLQEFPNTTFSDKASNLLIQLKQQETTQRRDQLDNRLDRRTSDNPERINAEQIKENKLTNIRENNKASVLENLRLVDDQAWENAKQINTLVAYQQYVNRHPKGQYLDEAKRRIKLIQDRE